MTDYDAEFNAILEGAEKAGLVEVYIDDEGQQIMRLTPKGEQVARQQAMTDEEGQDALMGRCWRKMDSRRLAPK